MTTKPTPTSQTRDIRNAAGELVAIARTPASQPSPTLEELKASAHESELLMNDHHYREKHIKELSQPSPARSDKEAERAPSGESIATWQDRMRPGYVDGGADLPEEIAMKAEIADLRAALARRATAGTTAAPALEALYVIRDYADERSDAMLHNIVTRAIMDSHRATAGTTAPAPAIECDFSGAPPCAECVTAGRCIGAGVDIARSYKLVPLEPTDEQIRAVHGTKGSLATWGELVAEYKLMINAFTGNAATAAPGDLTDDQIIEIMAVELDKGDGGYLRDTYPAGIAKAGRALLASNAGAAPVGAIIDKNNGANTPSLPPTPVAIWIGSMPPIGSTLYAAPSNPPVGAKEKE